MSEGAKGMSMSKLLTGVLWAVFCGLAVALPQDPSDIHDNDETIVRSFFPMLGEKQSPLFGDHEMFFFNISAVTANEEITRARLHLHRRRISKTYPSNQDRQLLPAPSRVIFYQTRSEDARPRKLGHIPVNSQSLGGWAPPLDVTAILREIHGRPLLLGVRFEAPKGIHLSINNFLKRNKSKKKKSSMAYLIVLSKSDQHEGLDEPKERHLKHKERKADNNELSNDINQIAEVRHRSKHKVYEVRRTKEAEQELRRRTHLQSLPFLHVNEVADMRRSLRKAKRSIDTRAKLQHHQKKTFQKDVGCRGERLPWLLNKLNQVCGGHCVLPDQDGSRGCCRLKQEDPQTVVMAEENNHTLTLHKLPRESEQGCECSRCD